LKTKGETAARLRLLNDWRRAPVFTDREEAALNLAEALTHDPIGAVSDDVVHATFFFFNENEMLCLILAILAANDWHYLKSFENGNMTGRSPHE
jgi:alkylhydroperoxidase family enzyme